ncbi:MAG: LCP family protein [candidate division SR1 bacterium]|nr:LCP family protein [candidate division SR1 bacterium]
MFKKNKFQKKIIGEVQNYKSYSDMLKPRRRRSFGKVLFVIVCIFLAIFLGKYLLTLASAAFGQISKGAVNMMSTSLGTPMQIDENGNINVMVVGYGGEGHAGSFLADSIMVASFNPKLGATTMISIPRDLYVYDTGYGIMGRINEVFAVGVGSKREFATGALFLSSMLEQILGLKISYYAAIDFGGFKDVVDTLGGITVDVPESFSDSTYPTVNNGYMTVSFTSGIQNMNGETALEYARSRHSTSDFSRSLRQQIIIKAIIDKMKSQGLGTVTKLKKLYSNYTSMVKTNISLKEMMGMAKYMDKLDNMFSYGLTTECSNITYKYSSPGCFLYTPDRSLFNGASVMIPDGASPGKVGFYDYTRIFASYVAHNQKYLMERAKISIMNGIDKTVAKQMVKKADGFANNIAVKLKKYAFDVVDVRNFSQVVSGTVAYIISTGHVDETIKTMKTFFPIASIQKDPGNLGFEALTGVDLVVVLGNDYLTTLVNQPFNYYK